MKTGCPYCGNNPVPHRFYWYTESLNIFFTPLRQKFLYNRLSSFFNSGLWLGRIGNFSLDLGVFFGIISFQKDAKLCKVRRAQVLWEEAEKRGIQMEELQIFGKPIDSYAAEKKYPSTLIHNPLPLKIKDNGSRIIFSGLPRPEGYTNRWLDLMDDKWLFKKVMMENGLPVPKGASCSRYYEAERIFQKIQNSDSSALNLKSPISNLKSAIVKPRAGSRGRHSTTFVLTENDLKKAYKIAKQLCFWVMVEEQLQGPVYRATVINGNLAGVLRGDPPQVFGDGIKNISQLINIKNSLPHPGVKNILPDTGMELFLLRQNLTLLSVVPAGQAVNLSEKIGVNYGGSSSEDFEICHPENKEMFLSAAKVLGDPIVGFDFIIPDVTKSYKQQKCGFIEVNSLPFINLHHDPLLGTPRNAAAMVWDMLGW
jgi:hypothetical protein